MRLRYKFWFEKDGEPILGRGGADILKAIEESGSITGAAQMLGMSYRFVWNYLQKMEDRIGKVVERERGGKSGGGTSLTTLGRALLERYLRIEGQLEEIAREVEKELEKELKRD
jgi:molybdate transport system regulatory protein